MGFSIQDYLKKINSYLTFPDYLSLLITTLFLLVLLLFLSQQKSANDTPLVYHDSKDTTSNEKSYDERPFASSKGTTYTFSWCQGGSAISLKNKIYFNNEEEAKNSGRALSKLCKR